MGGVVLVQSAWASRLRDEAPGETGIEPSRSLAVDRSAICDRNALATSRRGDSQPRSRQRQRVQPSETLFWKNTFNP